MWHQCTFDLSHCCRVTMRYGGSDITRMFYWLLTQVSYTSKQFVDPASFSIPLLFLIFPSPPFHLLSSIPSTSTLPSSLSPQLSLLPSPFSITLPFLPPPPPPRLNSPTQSAPLTAGWMEYSSRNSKNQYVTWTRVSGGSRSTSFQCSPRPPVYFWITT